MGKRTLVFVIYTVGLLMINAGVLRDLISLAINNPTASHLVLVPFVSLGLILTRRDSIFRSVRSGGHAAVGLLAAGAALTWYGGMLRASGPEATTLALSMCALVVLWISGFLLCYGPQACLAARFPLSFLIFMIPIPVTVLDSVVSLLKSGSAAIVAGLLSLTGTPFVRDGFEFSLPNVVILIADECSGIRSSIGLFLTSLLAGDIFLQTGWKKALLVVAMFPLAIVKNAIRIVTLVELSIHVDPHFLTGQLHHEGGMVFYLLTLMIAAPLFMALQASEPPILKETDS